jgi:transposase
VFARIFRDLAKPGADGDTLMIDSTHLKAHRTAAGLETKGGAAAGHRAHERRLNSKLHMVGDGRGRPLTFFLSPGQTSDARGALVLLASLPKAKRLFGDKGYDADWLRDELKLWGLRICIPTRCGRLHPARHNRRLCKKRCRIEDAFAKLKDWRGIAMRLTRAAATSSCPPSRSQPVSSSGCRCESRP